MIKMLLFNLRLQIILWIILLIGFIGCIGNGKKQQVVNQQIDNINVNDNMIDNSKFDIKSFEQHKEDFCHDNYVGYREVLHNDTLREYGKYTSKDEIEYSILEYYKNSYFCYQKAYYENGNIKFERRQIIGGNMCTGISHYYSIDGKLLEEVNEDEGYFFTFDELMHCLEKKGIYFPKGIKQVMENFSWNGKISKRIVDNLAVYVVTYLLPNGEKNMLIISGKDGSVMNEYQCVTESY